MYLELTLSFPTTEKLNSILAKFNSNVSVLSLVVLEKEQWKWGKEKVSVLNQASWHEDIWVMDVLFHSITSTLDGDK